MNPIKNVVNWFKELWTNIETNYPMVAGFLTTLFSPIQMIIDGFKWLINNGGNFLGTILDSIGDWTGGVADWFEEAEKETENYYNAKSGVSTNTNEEVYKTIGSKNVTKPTETKIDNSVTIPGGVTIIQQPGQDGTDLANDFIGGLQRNLSKSGK